MFCVCSIRGFDEILWLIPIRTTIPVHEMATGEVLTSVYTVNAI